MIVHEPGCAWYDGLCTCKVQAEPETGGEMISPISTTKGSYIGFRFVESPDFKAKHSPWEETTMVMYEWTTVPWYARLLGLVRLPYDLVKFVVTGRLILIPWPWRW